MKQKRNSPGNGVGGAVHWRRGAESNRADRICNPVHNRFATAPSSASRRHMSDEADSMKKGSLGFPFCCSGAGEESRTLDLNLGKANPLPQQRATPNYTIWRRGLSRNVEAANGPRQAVGAHRLWKSGVSTSLGVRGAHVTLGHGKVRVGVAGTGFSYTETHNVGGDSPQREEARPRTQSPPVGLVLFVIVVAIVLVLAYACSSLIR